MNNKINNFLAPYDVKGSDLSELTFSTQEKTYNILSEEDIREISNDLNKIWIEYIKELKNKNISSESLNEILYFMINMWMPQVVLLQKEFNVDTKDIEIDIFLKWFANWMNWLEDSEFFKDFVNLYKNPQELLEKIWEKIDLLLLFHLILYWAEFSKYDDEKMNIVLKEFEKFLKKEKLFDRINKIWFYDWYNICYDLFENYELAYSKMQNIFNFTEEEKDEFEKLKENHFFLSYQTEIDKTIESFEENNFIKIREYTYNDTYWVENKYDFIDKVKKILVWINHKSAYSVKFLDISWKQVQFNIWNWIELWWYNFNLLENNDFLKNIVTEYWEFILNLEKNNMDFSILIFKENWDKDDIPDEEDLLQAA